MTPQQPYPQPGVWPPPPTNQPVMATFPFRTVFQFVKGSVPEFRLGTLSLSDSGLLIQGKAVPRYEIQIPIIAVCFLVRFVWIIAYCIMEYGIRRDVTLMVPWASVEQVVLDSRKRRTCVVYDAPNYKGVVKKFSLTSVYEPGQFESFAAAANQYAPGRVVEGRLRAWTSPITWTVVVGILVSLVLLGILTAYGGAMRGT